MRKSILGLTAVLLATVATPAFAQDEDTSGITISGSATVVSDYRFRGVTQSDEDFAIQGGITASHESGFYIGTWGSSIGSWGGGTEIDFFGGFAAEVVSGVTVDIGATYYWYPSGTGDTDVIEPYISVSGDIGPVSAKVGLAYAPEQDSLGDASSVYTYLDLSTAIPTTPFTLKGHIGYAKSDSFLGGDDGKMVDYLIGIDASWKNLTFGIAYVNTDWKKSLGKEGAGADGAVLFMLGAAF